MPSFAVLADSQTPNFITDIIMPLVPWVVIVPVLLIFFLPMARRQRAQSARLNQRAIEHWDAVERKLDRLIELVEHRRDGN